MTENISIDKKNRLGNGYHANVYTHNLQHNNRKVALRLIKRERDSNCLLYDLEHPNIVRILDKISTNSKVGNYEAEVYPVLDGDLTDYIFPPQAIFNLIRQILEGVEFLRSKGITHRDIKAENVLLHLKKSDGSLLSQEHWIAKIADFTMAIQDPKGDNFYKDIQGVLSTLWYCLETFYRQKKGISLKDRWLDEDEHWVPVERVTPLRNFFPKELLIRYKLMYKISIPSIQEVKDFIAELETFIFCES